jgi:hypothetical protein
VLSRIAKENDTTKSAKEQLLSKKDSTKSGGVTGAVADSAQLKAALAQALTPLEEVKSTGKEVSGSSASESTTDVVTSVVPQAAGGDVASKRDELAAMAAEAESAFANLSARTHQEAAPAPTSSDQSNGGQGPDKKHIERMLRSTSERSPFA